MVKTIDFYALSWGCPSGTSMKFGRNNTTEKSVAFKGFRQPMPVFNVVRLKESEAQR